MSILRRAVALALAVGASRAAAQNVVQNGGFEVPAITGNLTLSGCPAGFVWCIGQGDIDLIESAWVPAEGRQSIDLNGTTAGSIFQDLVTTPGQAYALSFRFSGNPDGPFAESMEIFWGGTSLGIFTWIVSPFQSPTDMFWSPVTIEELLATTATTRLEFRSLTTAACVNVPEPACGPALDAVQVVPFSAVPEPATLALVGAGVLGLGAARRRTGTA